MAMALAAQCGRAFSRAALLAAGLLLLLLFVSLASLSFYRDAFYAPWQVHIALSGKGYNSAGVTIMWATEATDARSEVEWGLYSEGLAHVSVTQGNSTTYQDKSYSSGRLHWVELDDLEFDTVYRYRCGDSHNRVWSKEFTFRTKPATSHSYFKSVTLGVIGDSGSTEEAKSVLFAMARDSSLHMILHVGDHSYSDWNEKKWDDYGSILEKLASTRHYMGTIGNHELYNNFGSAFPYSLRYRMPLAEGNTDHLSGYYSFDYGPVHIVVLNSEINSNKQRRWAETHLERVDRRATPWLVVAFHRPWYNSNHVHHLEGEAMKNQLESLLHQYHVDLVLAGHVHAYERTHPVYRGELFGEAPTYINVGTGGTHEGHANRWFAMPNWSAFREGRSWGYGKLEVMNSTHARWTWYRVDRQPSQATEGDSVLLVHTLL